jgi:hypothetical protein
MKRNVFAIASAITSLAVSALVAGPAQALMVAGWDFSQWFGPGALSVDGTGPANTLGANYSNLDPTNNAGAESAAFGTLYINGQFGSTNVVPDFSGNEGFVPSVDSLGSNLTAPVDGGGLNPFDSHQILQAEGQQFVSALSMTAQDIVQVVFAAASVLPGFDWSVSFGGRTLSGNGTVGIEFSTDGASYIPAGSVSLGSADTPFSVPLPAPQTDSLFVRFDFSNAGTENLPAIDNVAIHATLVPEPGTALLLSSGLAGLVSAGRRRHH